MSESLPAHGSEDFETLAQAIAEAHRQMAAQASRAVNIGLSLRNWLIGRHIAEFELEGKDRAEYGEHLFSRLATRLKVLGVPGCDRRELYRYRDFFTCYPQIMGTLSPQSSTRGHECLLEPGLARTGWSAMDSCRKVAHFENWWSKCRAGQLAEIGGKRDTVAQALQGFLRGLGYV